MTTRTVNIYHERRHALIERLGGVCFFCGGTDSLQVHHANGMGKRGLGGWQQLLRLEREEREGVTLLPMCGETCHKKWHDEIVGPREVCTGIIMLDWPYE